MKVLVVGALGFVGVNISLFFKEKHKVEVIGVTTTLNNSDLMRIKVCSRMQEYFLIFVI